MEVTVNIPDEFVERLIPPGRDASRVLLEELVGRARDSGRIDAEEAKELLGCAAEVAPDGGLSDRESLQPFFDRYLDGETPEWIDDPEQVRLHAAAAKFIGIANSGNPNLSQSVREIVRERLGEKYGR